MRTEIYDEELSRVARNAVFGAYARRQSGMMFNLGRRERYRDGEAGTPEVPEGANRELKDIAENSRLNMCRVVVDAFTNGLQVSGFRSPDSSEDEPIWNWWNAQRLTARQTEVHEAAVTSGWSFVSVLPDEEDQPAARIWSATEVDAVYDDPRNDMFPKHATLWRCVPTGWAVYHVDSVSVRSMRVVEERGAAQVVLEDEWEHGVTYDGVPVCPVVRFRDKRTVGDYASTGEVEPIIPLQKSLNGVNFERLVASRFSVFNQKVIIGWTAPRDQLLKASNSRVWTFEDHPSDVEVKSLPSSPITPYNELIRELKEQIALEASVPIYQATGSVANVSENTLAMVEKAHNAKLTLKRRVFGEAWENVLRLAASLLGASISDTAEVLWKDTSPRPIGGVVDAIQKLSAQGVPVEELIDLVPGISQRRADTIRRKMADARAEQEKLMLASPEE